MPSNLWGTLGSAEWAAFTTTAAAFLRLRDPFSRGAVRCGRSELSFARSSASTGSAFLPLVVRAASIVARWVPAFANFVSAVANYLVCRSSRDTKTVSMDVTLSRTCSSLWSKTFILTAWLEMVDYTSDTVSMPETPDPQLPLGEESGDPVVVARTLWCLTMPPAVSARTRLLRDTRFLFSSLVMLLKSDLGTRSVYHPLNPVWDGASRNYSRHYLPNLPDGPLVLVDLINKTKGGFFHFCYVDLSPKTSFVDSDGSWTIDISLLGRLIRALYHT